MSNYHTTVATILENIRAYVIIWTHCPILCFSFCPSFVFVNAASQIVCQPIPRIHCLYRYKWTSVSQKVESLHEKKLYCLGVQELKLELVTKTSTKTSREDIFLWEYGYRENEMKRPTTMKPFTWTFTRNTAKSSDCYVNQTFVIICRREEDESKEWWWIEDHPLGVIMDSRFLFLHNFKFIVNNDRPKYPARKSWLTDKEYEPGPHVLFRIFSSSDLHKIKRICWRIMRKT